MGIGLQENVLRGHSKTTRALFAGAVSTSPDSPKAPQNVVVARRAPVQL